MSGEIAAVPTAMFFCDGVHVLHACRPAGRGEPIMPRAVFGTLLALAGVALLLQ